MNLHVVWCYLHSIDCELIDASDKGLGGGQSGVQSVGVRDTSYIQQATVPHVYHRRHGDFTIMCLYTIHNQHWAEQRQKTKFVIQYNGTL